MWKKQVGAIGIERTTPSGINPSTPGTGTDRVRPASPSARVNKRANKRRDTSRKDSQNPEEKSPDQPNFDDYA